MLLELFTSEGWSSCPTADRLLEILDQKQFAGGADLIVLSEHVDYWDRLGWKDPFSSSQYTSRQQDYTNKYNFDGVYTPQLVVDGRFGCVGSDGREASSAIGKAIRERKIPIEISNVSRDAIADNRAESRVARGENAGQSLTHAAVSRVLRQVGTIELDSASAKGVSL